MQRIKASNLNRGLVGAWCPSVPGSGLLLPDLSGRGNNGVLTNMDASDWVGTDRGRALDFDSLTVASAQFVNIPSFATVRNQAKVSIVIWALLQSAPGGNAGLYYEPTSGNGFTKFGLFQTTANAVLFVCRDSTFGSAFTVTATPTANELVNIVGCYNSDTDRMEMFFNAVSVGINTTSKGPLDDTAPASPPAIGAFTESNVITNRSCNASISDVRLFARILTSSEIKQLYEGGPGYGLKPERKRSRFVIQQQFNVGRFRRQQLIGSGVY